jgi:hypothetical protein
LLPSVPKYLDLPAKKWNPNDEGHWISGGLAVLKIPSPDFKAANLQLGLPPWGKVFLVSLVLLLSQMSFQSFYCGVSNGFQITTGTSLSAMVV